MTDPTAARCKFCGSTDAEYLTSDPATIRDASVWCDPWCCGDGES